MKRRERVPCPRPAYKRTNSLHDRTQWPGYLSKHNDVKANAVGLDECAVLVASHVTVVLGKPGDRRIGERKRHRPA